MNEPLDKTVDHIAAMGPIAEGEEDFMKPSQHFSTLYSLDMLPSPSLDFSLRLLVNCFFRGLARTELCPHICCLYSGLISTGNAFLTRPRRAVERGERNTDVAQ